MLHKICALVIALSIIPPVASAQQCQVPPFEPFQPRSAETPFLKTSIEVDLRPVIKLALPTGFTKFSATPDGGLGLGKHPRDIKAMLVFENEETLSIHSKGAKPASFFLSVFGGLDPMGCQYLEPMKLEQQDYRIHASLAQGAELFAYGKGKDHHFYVIRADQPDRVLIGLIRNVTRTEFESVLSTIKLD